MLNKKQLNIISRTEAQYKWPGKINTMVNRTAMLYHGIWSESVLRRDGVGSKWLPILKVWEKLCDSHSKVKQNAYRQNFCYAIVKKCSKKWTWKLGFCSPFFLSFLFSLPFHKSCTYHINALLSWRCHFLAQTCHIAGNFEWGNFLYNFKRGSLVWRFTSSNFPLSKSSLFSPTSNIFRT